MKEVMTLENPPLSVRLQVRIAELESQLRYKDALIREITEKLGEIAKELEGLKSEGNND